MSSTGLNPIPKLHSLLAGFTLAVAALVPLPALAWGSQGHQIVAALAQSQLTPAARKKVDRLLALESRETLESISTWADEHRKPNHLRGFRTGSLDRWFGRQEGIGFNANFL